jgi:hypothetical protein
LVLMPTLLLPGPLGLSTAGIHFCSGGWEAQAQGAEESVFARGLPPGSQQSSGIAGGVRNLPWTPFIGALAQLTLRDRTSMWKFWGTEISSLLRLRNGEAPLFRFWFSVELPGPHRTGCVGGSLSPEASP